MLLKTGTVEGRDATLPQRSCELKIGNEKGARCDTVEMVKLLYGYEIFHFRKDFLSPYAWKDSEAQASLCSLNFPRRRSSLSKPLKIPELITEEIYIISESPVNVVIFMCRCEEEDLAPATPFLFAFALMQKHRDPLHSEDLGFRGF